MDVCSLSVDKAEEFFATLKLTEFQEKIAREIIKISGSKSRIVYRPLPEDDPKVRRPDITRATGILGWQPRVQRREGLQRTLEYFRRKLGVEATATA